MTHAPFPNVSQLAQPTNGQTVTVNAGTSILTVNPAGTLATLTIALPASAFLPVTIFSTSILTLITMTTAAGTITNPLATLAANNSVQFTWNPDLTLWFRS